MSTTQPAAIITGGTGGMGIATPLESVRTWVRLNALLASMQLGLRESDRQSRKVRRPKA